MASTTPTQERVVDPFASFNSNVVNKISEIVTHNTDGLLTINSLQVSLNSISPTTTVDVSTGYIVKDDVLINITATHEVDFTDDDQWITPPTLTFAGGTCYLVLKYTYQKQRPAPIATIRILQPSERGTLATDSSYFFLKAVELSATTPHPITAIYDYDPDTVTYPNSERNYLRYYAGGVTNLPTFDQVRDQGRIVYESERDKFFFGYESGYNELTAGGVTVDVNSDSTSVSPGEICYVDENGDATPSISTSFNTQADMVILSNGTAAEGTGQGIVSGFATGVPVESSTYTAIAKGDILYLSAADAGTVTNVKPPVLYQVVGRALTTASSTTPVDMIFSPKMMLLTNSSGQISGWAGPDGDGLYYHDIDVSALDGTGVFDCTWFDDATDTQIVPSKVEIRNSGDVIRVYMDVNTLTLNYMIQSTLSAGGSGGGGGGGGGVSDHNLLLNLDYASSGHTGFAPTPHDNTHHSQSYITTTAVTYTNLDNNGDVGDGSSQVAQGDHTHTISDPHNYNDIPSGSTILFESDTAIVGYTLLTDQDDQIVYITKGSAAGGDTGGTLKTGSTWSQPVHAHGIQSVSNHSHTTGDLALTIAQMPAHTHTYIRKGPTTGNTLAGGDPWSVGNTTTNTSSAGSGAVHNHGATGGNGGHDHAGQTLLDGTGSSWRPRGRNYTRQTRL